MLTAVAGQAPARPRPMAYWGARHCEAAMPPKQSSLLMSAPGLLPPRFARGRNDAERLAAAPATPANGLAGCTCDAQRFFYPPPCGEGRRAKARRGGGGAV